MVFMPPGHAKTKYASILFPPFFMRNGGMDVIGASHGAEYAEDLSGQVIRTIAGNTDTLAYGLINEGAKLWRTTNRGTYRAAGAGGSITGRRADLFLIDDPIKGREDADSQTIRDKVWNWYRAEVITRLKPGARIVLIQTRWHEDDLAGRLLQEMHTGADQWRVINLPAIAEDNDAMGRQPGEPLWPAWEDVEALQRKRAVVGEREWAALFQQHPRPNDGSLFKVAELGVYDTAPAITGRVVRAWDLAATDQIGSRDPDWTVGLKMMREASGRFVVLDVVRLRGGPDEVERAIVNTAAQDGRGVAIRLPEDPGQAGKQQSLYLTRKLAGYIVQAERETGDKATRAAPVASQCNAGNVLMVRAPWNAVFRDELAGFPFGSHDDQVDALSGAFAVVGIVAPPLAISPHAVSQIRAMRR